MATSFDWWRTLFHGLALEVWRQAVTPEQTRSEADFIADLLAVPPGARLLDVPCGYGRHAVELASRGYPVTGIDVTPDFIADAEARARDRGVSVDFSCGDMQQMTFDQVFDGAYCCGFSFPYFDDAGNRTFLAAAARALKPGGRFLLETFALAELTLPAFVERREMAVGDMVMKQEKRYDIERGCVETDYTFRRGDVEQKAAMVQLLYLYRDLVRMVKEAGFRQVEGYGSPQREPIKIGSGRLLLVATR
jgi:SAM-dependent methyltransferase